MNRRFPWHEAGEEQGREAGEAVYTVGELTRQLRDLVESEFDAVAVRGEVSGLSRPQSGHVYFSLVDSARGARESRLGGAQIPVVLWRSTAERMRFRLENGMKVVASGRVTLYEPRGTYQLIASRVRPEGTGELELAFEQLKRRLEAEGLFDRSRKRPLPFLPRAIGLVTSPTGAAMRDFCRLLYDRFPGAVVRIVPVRVQGEGAAGEIARAIDLFHDPEPQVDVIVCARGGGSIEDLWAFNEEVVARALARSRIPTVSAVGHEVDFTIADFVADVRAPTPSAAAELVVPSATELERALEDAARRLERGLGSRLEARFESLRQFTRAGIFRDPQVLLQRRFDAVDRLASALDSSLYIRWRNWNDAVARSAARLASLNPVSVLARGYSVTTRVADGRILHQAAAVRPGEQISIQLAQGRLRAVVESSLPASKEAVSADGGSGGGADGGPRGAGPDPTDPAKRSSVVPSRSPSEESSRATARRPARPSCGP